MLSIKTIRMLFFAISLLFLTNLITTNIKAQDNKDLAYLAFAEELPEPVDGLKSVYKKISYPKVAKMAGIEGKVYVLVYINEGGDVDDVKVIRGIGGGCDEATIDALKQTKFKPGKNAGNPVKVKLGMSIEFKLK